MVSLNNAVYMATLCLDPSNYTRPSTNRLRSVPFQGANTGSSPVGCTICRHGGMVDTRALGARARRRAGSSPVVGTSEVVQLQSTAARSSKKTVQGSNRSSNDAR